MKNKHKEPKVELSEAAILKDGLNSAFWRTLKKIIEDERAEINAAILQLGLDDGKMGEVKDLIKWHDFLGYASSLPEKAIESLEKKPVNDGTERKETQDENDPYFPISEIREKIISK